MGSDQRGSTCGSPLTDCNVAAQWVASYEIDSDTKSYGFTRIKAPPKRKQDKFAFRFDILK